MSQTESPVDLEMNANPLLMPGRAPPPETSTLDTDHSIEEISTESESLLVPRKTLGEDEGPVTCEKCRSDDDEIYTLACGHQFCHYCFTKHWTEYRYSGRPLHLTPCLNKNCEVVISNEIKNKAAKKNLAESLDKLNRVIENLEGHRGEAGANHRPFQRLPGQADEADNIDFDSLFPRTTEQPKMSSFMNGDFKPEFYMEMGRSIVSSYSLRVLICLILAPLLPVLLLLGLLLVGTLFLFTALPSFKGGFLLFMKGLAAWVVILLIGTLTGIWTYLSLLYVIESYIFSEMWHSFKKIFTG